MQEQLMLEGGLDVDIWFYLGMICLACVLNCMYELYGMKFQFYTSFDSGLMAFQRHWLMKEGVKRVRGK